MTTVIECIIYFHTDLSLRSSPSEVLGSHSFLNSVDFELISLAVTHSTILRFLQTEQGVADISYITSFYKILNYIK